MSDTTAPEQASPPGQPLARVLVVDPTEMGGLLQMLLQRHRIDAHLCRTAGAALDAILAAPPALAIIDLDLPDASGVDLLHILRQPPENVPVVFTGSAPKEALSQNVQRGVEAAQGFFQKPLHAKLLLDALSMRFQDFKLPKDPACPACGERPTLRTLIDYQQFCGIPQAVAPTEDTLEILPATLRARLDRGERLILLDVRDPHELAISQIDGGQLIPLSELAARLAELDPADEIVAYCRTGVRSARAVAMLRQAGFPRVHNLVGGINRWAEEVDGSLPRY